MTMSWSIRLVVCKSTKNSWASCAMSKLLLNQTKSSWLSMLWSVKKRPMWRVNSMNNSKWPEWSWPRLMGIPVVVQPFLSVRLLGSQSNLLVLVKKSPISKPSTQTACLVGSSVWGICWHWLRRLLKNTMRNVPLNSLRKCGKIPLISTISLIN